MTLLWLFLFPLPSPRRPRPCPLPHPWSGENDSREKGSPWRARRKVTPHVLGQTVGEQLEDGLQAALGSDSAFLVSSRKQSSQRVENFALTVQESIEDCFGLAIKELFHHQCSYAGIVEVPQVELKGLSRHTPPKLAHCNNASAVGRVGDTWGMSDVLARSISRAQICRFQAPTFLEATSINLSNKVGD